MPKIHSHGHSPLLPCTPSSTESCDGPPVRRVNPHVLCGRAGWHMVRPGGHVLAPWFTTPSSVPRLPQENFLACSLALIPATTSPQLEHRPPCNLIKDALPSRPHLTEQHFFLLEGKSLPFKVRFQSGWSRGIYLPDCWILF